MFWKKWSAPSWWIAIYRYSKYVCICLYKYQEEEKRSKSGIAKYCWRNCARWEIVNAQIYLAEKIYIGIEEASEDMCGQTINFYATVSSSYLRVGCDRVLDTAKIIQNEIQKKSRRNPKKTCADTSSISMRASPLRICGSMWSKKISSQKNPKEIPKKSRRNRKRTCADRPSISMRPSPLCICGSGVIESSIQPK